MDVELKREIAAVVTLDPQAVGSSAAPVFHVKDGKALEQTAITLSNVLRGTVHDLGNGVLIIVKR